MEPLILAIDTSTEQMTVVVSRGAKILASRSMIEKHQVQKLLTVIDDCLREANVKISDVDAFSTTKGPGSFTGVRIALGTTKSFAYSCQKPVIAVSTLEALVYPCDRSQKIAPVLHARSGFIYTALYEYSKSWNELIPPSMMAVEQFREQMPKEVGIVGRFARENPELFSSLHPFGSSKFDFICDTTLSAISLKKYIHQEFEDVFSLEPLYIQKTAAEGYV